MPDPHASAAEAARAHLAAIAAADEALEEGTDLTGNHPATDLWDGCTDCVVREALAVALPAHRAAIAAQLTGAGHPAAAALLTPTD